MEMYLQSCHKAMNIMEFPPFLAQDSLDGGDELAIGNI